MKYENKFSDFFSEKLLNLFPGDKYNEFIEASYKVPVTIRTNTLKISRSALYKLLIKRGIEVSLMKDDNYSLCVDSSNGIPIGATPEYLAGYYTIQGLSSLIPVLNMELKKKCKVFDMCAAPGGKSSFIAQLMDNTGIMQCNELNKERINSIISNFMRLGIKNAYITNSCGTKLDDEKFDRVLLDAPCSGSGVIYKANEVHFLDRVTLQRLSTVQKDLLLKAYSKVKTGGLVIYSTCSVLCEENEEVVNYLLNKVSGASLEEVEGKINSVEGKNGFKDYRGKYFNPKMVKTKRFYPQIHMTAGFFVAKIRNN